MAVAGISTVAGNELWFDVPTLTCITFVNCEHWHNANKVVWNAVSVGVRIHYYSKKDCHDADFKFATTKNKGSGVVDLPNTAGGYSLKSLMAVGPATRMTKRNATQCFVNRDHFHEHTGIANSNDHETNSTEWETMSQSGSGQGTNVSLNWFEPLPEGDASTDGGSNSKANFGEDAATAGLLSSMD
ncbi:hypothetical protein BBJ28_00022823 [Nothophytophthora sp. Chile5]|nr:hypothetical protein BBJ28_00022823 [Nothophytophthora sp. Chile5]